MNTKIVLQWGLAAAAAAALSSCVDNYGGGPGYGGGYGYEGGGYAPGYVVNTLPPRYETVYYGGSPYYYYNNVYYRRQAGRYVVVERPPIRVRPGEHVGPRPGYPGNGYPGRPNPGWTPKPGFNQPQPRPGWTGNQPRPGYNNPGYNAPKPGWNQPGNRPAPPAVAGRPAYYGKQNLTPGTAPKKVKVTTEKEIYR